VTPTNAPHEIAGWVLIGVNALAFLVGGVQWWRGETSRVFWPLLRLGQVLVIAEAIDGGVLVLQGDDLPSLHLIYGLVPLAVSFVAEQLRLAAADQVLDQRGLEGRRDVERLPVDEQHALVRGILRREMGVMAASAGVVALLGIRAAGLL
jgi:hypothetical protein